VTPDPHPCLPALTRLDQRELLAARLAPAHMAADPAIDPDPGYQPRHRRTNP
jgi:hypothetical protein